MERIARVVVLVLVLSGVVFGGIAVAGGYHGSPKPGKGCGDRNHVHYRENVSQVARRQRRRSQERPSHGPSGTRAKAMAPGSATTSRPLR